MCWCRFSRFNVCIPYKIETQTRHSLFKWFLCCCCIYSIASSIHILTCREPFLPLSLTYSTNHQSHFNFVRWIFDDAFELFKNATCHRPTHSLQNQRRQNTTYKSRYHHNIYIHAYIKKNKLFRLHAPPKLLPNEYRVYYCTRRRRRSHHHRSRHYFPLHEEIFILLVRARKSNIYNT